MAKADILSLEKALESFCPWMAEVYLYLISSIQLLKDQNGFLMVGNGYTITKVTVE